MDLTGLAIDNQLLSRMNAEIGSIRKTMKDPAAFSNETMGDWMLMNGQSCVGTQYETDFTSSNVPDAYTEGTFLRQAKAGRGTPIPANFSTNSSHSTNSSGGGESRPKNIAVNFMIKVNH